MKKRQLKTTSHSTTQTKELAKELASSLKGGEVICLYGDLGGGKTTFIKGLAEGLGIKEIITSPTFILHRSYNAQRSGISRLHHIDLYRIASIRDIEALGLDEMLSESISVITIEWAEKIKKILPRKRIDIYFDYLDENKREITFSYENPNS